MDGVFDKIFYSEGELIAGLDEAGVSDIAGPLVAACVILPKIDLHKDNLKIFEVDDSKKIPEKYRKAHAEVIWETAIAIGIGEVSPPEVDYLGKQASASLAMLRALLACKTPSKGKPLKPDFLLIDGRRSVQANIRQVTIQDGDEKSLCVAAASIVAKVYRDDIMVRLHENFPFYDWVNNKGYPCEKHFVGIDAEGAQIGIHRIKAWPFSANPKYQEDVILWTNRRRRWRRRTEEKLGIELGAKIWTTNPPLWKPSPDSKSLKQLIQASGPKLKPSKKHSNENKTPQPSL